MKHLNLKRLNLKLFQRRRFLRASVHGLPGIPDPCKTRSWAPRRNLKPVADRHQFHQNLTLFSRQISGFGIVGPIVGRLRSLAPAGAFGRFADGSCRELDSRRRGAIQQPSSAARGQPLSRLQRDVRPRAFATRWRAVLRTSASPGRSCRRRIPTHHDARKAARH